MIFAAEIFQFIYNNFWHLLVIGYVLWNLRGFTKALKGYNGKWQIEEVSKTILLVLIVFVVVIEAFRGHEWHIFSDTVIILLLFTLIVMAKMEKALEYFEKFMNKWRKK